jgi:C-terminal processing protease CtpA/Prc
LHNGGQIQRQASSHYISPIAQQTTKAFINQNEYHVIELRKHQSSGFGFSIRGGKEFNIPLYVLKLAPNGVAAMDGRLQVGDQILEINSQDAYNMTHSEAIERIKMVGNMVTLLVRRTGMPPPSITDIIAVNSSVQHQQPPQQHYVHQPQIVPSLSTNNLSNNNNNNNNEMIINHQLRSKSPYLNGNVTNSSSMNINQNVKNSFNSSSTLVNRNY